MFQVIIKWPINLSRKYIFTSQNLLSTGLSLQFYGNCNESMEFKLILYLLLFLPFQFNWQKFPCVLKAGHCHGGTATARLENTSQLQDSAGLLCGSAVTGDAQCYCTLEPYIDAKYDIHIQKIGNNYKAFM